MVIYQAIETKFLPCTNYRPSRVKATAPAGSLILSWDHGLNVEENHARAAQALADRLGWLGEWHGGGLHPKGYVFVMAVPDGPAFITKHV